MKKLIIILLSLFIFCGCRNYESLYKSHLDSKFNYDSVYIERYRRDFESDGVYYRIDSVFVYNGKIEREIKIDTFLRTDTILISSKVSKDRTLIILFIMLFLSLIIYKIIRK